MARGDRARRVVWAVVATVAAPVVARVASAVGMPDLWPAVPLLGAFPLVVAVAAVLAVGLAVARWRGATTVPRAAVAATVLAAVVGGALLVPRAVARPQPDADGPELTVATLNVRRGRAAPAEVVSLVRAHEVDVLALVELTDELDAALRAAGLAELLPASVVAAAEGTGGGGVYSRGELALLERPATGGDTPDVVATIDGVELAVVSTHPTAPVGPARTARWRSGLGRIGIPSTRRAVVVVGDFNATLDHATLRDVLDRGWRDAAREAGAGLRPTYDGVVNGSPGLPMALDHVLVGPGIAVREVDVVDVEGTDHRFVVTRLQLP